MTTNDRTVKVLLMAIVLLLCVLVLRTGPGQIETVHAQTARFEHITIVSSLFLYGGDRGLLLLDKRNGNVWFMPQRDKTYGDPSFILRVPFEELDKQP